MGHVLIVNTLIESLFVYRFSVMPNISDEIFVTVQQNIVNFVWKGKRAKIAFHMLTKPKEQGGLRLVNLKVKYQALLIQ